MSNRAAPPPGTSRPGRRGGDRRARRERAEDVPSITGAQTPLTEEQSRRTRRYLWQMGLRLVCFLLAVVAGGGWLTWILIAAAVVLPYVAVLLANAGRDQQTYDVSAMEYRELPAAPSTLPPVAAPTTPPPATPTPDDPKDER
ncbi:DUF3099 domain-containing protein [Oerskovia flava]|uniref:DUF3099 domain-containing protein n=1 Tax=Oerskovia flava TaxID=2986422 RepID=UPI00223F2C3A|nr:DUF3099 domain-containing protein [Oerskovia sp. JB1-3-2]